MALPVQGLCFEYENRWPDMREISGLSEDALLVLERRDRQLEDFLEEKVCGGACSEGFRAYAVGTTIDGGAAIAVESTWDSQGPYGDYEVVTDWHSNGVSGLDTSGTFVTVPAGIWDFELGFGVSGMGSATGGLLQIQFEFQFRDGPDLWIADTCEQLTYNDYFYGRNCINLQTSRYFDKSTNVRVTAYETTDTSSISVGGWWSGTSHGPCSANIGTASF